MEKASKVLAMTRSATNVVIFGVDTNPSSHIDICKNKFLVLGEGDTFGINGSFGAFGISDGLHAIESREVYLGEIVYDFSVDLQCY